MEEQYLAAGRMMAGWSRVALFTHERPDGDALGCLMALASLLEQAKKAVLPVLFDEPGPRYGFLYSRSGLKLWRDVVADINGGWADGMIVADTCAVQQLTPLAETLHRRRVPLLAIDHHVTRDVVADGYVIDENASSTALLVAEMAQALGWRIDDRIAEALFVGMATDTGWFRFSSTDSRTLQIAAGLMEYGIKPDVLYERLYLSDSAARLKLMARMLAGLELLEGGRLAVATLTENMFRQSGAMLSETEDLVNEPMRIASVECSVLLSPMGTDGVKVSLRSRHTLDCAALAARLGGGGHPRAAGVRWAGTLEVARDKIVAAVLQDLRNS